MILLRSESCNHDHGLYMKPSSRRPPLLASLPPPPYFPPILPGPCPVPARSRREGAVTWMDAGTPPLTFFGFFAEARRDGRLSRERSLHIAAHAAATAAAMGPLPSRLLIYLLLVVRVNGLAGDTEWTPRRDAQTSGAYGRIRAAMPATARSRPCASEETMWSFQKNSQLYPETP
jgi:hypothetical protein